MTLTSVRFFIILAKNWPANLRVKSVSVCTVTLALLVMASMKK